VLDIEFHTIIMSFALTLLVTGVVFLYFRTRVSSLEDMVCEQNNVLRNYIRKTDADLDSIVETHRQFIDSMAQDTVVERRDVVAVSPVSIADIVVEGTGTKLMDLSEDDETDDDETDDDETDDDETDTDTDTDDDETDEPITLTNIPVDLPNDDYDSDSDSVDTYDDIEVDLDSDAIPINLDTENIDIGVTDITATPSQTIQMVEIDDISDGTATSPPNFDKYAKEQLCEHIVLNKLSPKPKSSLMKLRKEMLTSMCINK